MILETFTLLKTANKLQKTIKKREQRENYNSDIEDTDTLKKYLIIIIILVLVLLGLYIWAIIDASKNCDKYKVLHIILLLLIPGYLPIYFILRVTNVMCKKNSNQLSYGYDDY